MEQDIERGETDNISVTFNGETTEYDRVLISGKEKDEEGKNTSFMYGYEDFDMLVNDFSNILITTTQFIVSESDADREKVVTILKDVCEQTFQALLDGEFDQHLDDAEHIE